MCYNKTFIRIRPLNLTALHNTHAFVRCNRCFQCRVQNSENYLIRGTYELEKFKQLHGMTLNVLLTYNDANLPHIPPFVSHKSSYNHKVSRNCGFEYQNSYPHFDNLPCFNVDDITKFFDRLSTNLRNQYGFMPITSHFLVGENGDEKQRPHYHMIYNIALPKSHFHKVKDLIIKSWTKRYKLDKPIKCTKRYRDKRTGKYIYRSYYRKTAYSPIGLVFFNERCGKEFVTTNKALQYLTTYLQNDPFFDDIHKINLEQLNPRNRRIYEKKYGVFKLVSQNYGMYALDKGDINFNTYTITLPLKGVTVSKPLPFYYIRKICYNKEQYDGHDVYVPNGKYLEFYKQNLPKKVSLLKNAFYDFTTNFYKYDSHQIQYYYDKYIAEGALGDVTLLEYIPSFQSVKGSLKRYDPFLLLKYYLLYFLTYKNIQYDVHFDEFRTPWVPHNLDTVSDIELLELLISRVDIKRNINHIESALQNNINNKRFIYKAVRTPVRYWYLDHLCILFHAYQQVKLNTCNNIQIANWNAKAKEYSKTKYTINPHSLL